MRTAAKKEKFSAPMVWTDECVLPLAASGVYPKTRVWGSREKTLHCFSATAQLSGNSRRGCENSSGKTAAGSALDANGNTTSKTDSAGTTTYSWDYDNRLTSATLPGSGGTVSYRYDPFGRRIEKVSPTATSVYAYDGENLAEETNSTGAAIARYTRGLNIDEPLAMLRGGTTSFYHADGLGSATSLSSAAGSIAANYTYDSFGNIAAASGSIVNNFRYTGREFDTETNLYYYRARYFDPQAGRFLSEDPIRFGASVNFYPYVKNNPVLRTDPSGLIHQEWDGRLHDDAAGGLEVLCTQGRNKQQDIRMLQQSIFVRSLEILAKGEDADFNHVVRLVNEVATLVHCKDSCGGGDEKPQPEPVPDNVNEDNWWQHFQRFMKQTRFFPPFA